MKKHKLKISDKPARTKPIPKKRTSMPASNKEEVVNVNLDRTTTLKKYKIKHIAKKIILVCKVNTRGFTWLDLHQNPQTFGSLTQSKKGPHTFFLTFVLALLF